MLRGSSPLTGNLLRDRPDLLPEAASRPPQEQDMATERDEEGGNGQGADGAEHDPHDEPGGHLRRCYTRASVQAKRSVAAVREEVADVRVVLEEVVELDQVVRRQSRSRGLPGFHVLLVEELRGERRIHV